MPWLLMNRCWSRTVWNISLNTYKQEIFEQVYESIAHKQWRK